MTLTRILIDSSEPVYVPGLSEYARHMQYGEWLAFNLSALSTLEPPLLQETLLLAQRFLPTNIFIHCDLGLNSQTTGIQCQPTAPLFPFHQDGYSDNTLRPSDISAQNVLPVEMDRSNHTLSGDDDLQQVGSEGDENDFLSVVDGTPESGSMGEIVDPIFDDRVQIPLEITQHGLKPYTILEDFTNHENTSCSSLAARPLSSHSSHIASAGDCNIPGYDIRDCIESNNDSDDMAMVDAYPTPESQPAHTPRPANPVVKRPRKCKGKSVEDNGKQSASMLADLAGPDHSAQNKAESMRLDLLRSLMRKAGQSLNDETLCKIYELGDRIIHETAVVLNDWNEWLLREFQPPGILLPVCRDLSSVEICAAAYRFLGGTNSDNHRGSVHRCLAQVLFYVFVEETEKEIAMRGTEGDVILYKGRHPVTIAYDLIIEKVGAFERNGKRCDRTQLGDCKSYGKRWWRLGSGIGIVVVLAGSRDLAKYIENRSFKDDLLELLVNYIRNAYPSAVAHFQTLDPVVQSLFVNTRSPINVSLNLDPLHLQFNALPEEVQWIKTESAMTITTENFLCGLRQG